MYASTEQRNRERVQVLADQLYRERYQYLLRIAQRNGAGDGDAGDAVNDAFAAFISKFDSDGGAPPLAWLTTTVKRAAWAAYRRQHLDRRVGQEAAPDSAGSGFSIANLPAKTAGPEETTERAEYVLEARAKLAALKPAERRALVLIAAGYTYKEVGEITGWSYTKTNRSAAEGRARLRGAGARLASGASVRSGYHALTMVVTETSSGTPVVEMTAAEYAAYLEREVREATGLSTQEFHRAYLAGELDEADPAVSELAGLLRIGQNGHAA